MQSVDALEENRRLLDYAAEAAFVRGVVVWAPLTQPSEARAILDRLAEDAVAGGRSKLAGVRCLIGRSDADWALSREGVANFQRLAESGLSWDVVPVTPAQIAAVNEVAQRVPDLRIVVDHLARPPFHNEGWDQWCRDVSLLGARPNIAIKLSVGVDALSSWDQWDPAALRPYVEHALDAFSPERSMIASNWPVVLLKADYARAWQDTSALIAEIVRDKADLGRIHAGTATEWYGLEEGDTL
jgi:L-fuconolactonase